MSPVIEFSGTLDDRRFYVESHRDLSERSRLPAPTPVTLTDTNLREMSILNGLRPFL